LLNIGQSEHQNAAQSLAPAVVALTGDAAFGRLGPLEVRLARSHDEIVETQRLRRRVFFDQPNAAELDSDAFDENCDHLIVVDRERANAIVGTYRLLRQDRAAAGGGFYSEGEFELAHLLARHPDLRFLELGRSCVLPEYRTKRTIELLWQGIHAYLGMHSIDVMVGCASFPGITPAQHAQSLSYLAAHCSAQWPWSVRAVRRRYCSMDLMPAEAIDVRAAIAGLPPLIKAYLRVGAKVGEGCVVDADFGTVDVFIVMPVRRSRGATSTITATMAGWPPSGAQGMSSGRRPGRLR
jgi:putative hemolysin